MVLFPTINLHIWWIWNQLLVWILRNVFNESHLAYGAYGFERWQCQIDSQFRSISQKCLRVRAFKFFSLHWKLNTYLYSVLKFGGGICSFLWQKYERRIRTKTKNIMSYIRLLHAWKNEYNYLSNTTTYGNDTTMFLK